MTEQLNPGAIGDGACDLRLASAAYLTLGKSLTQLWSDHHADTTNYYNRMLPVAESECATLLRATYSKRQLYEVLVWTSGTTISASRVGTTTAVPSSCTTTAT